MSSRSAGGEPEGQRRAQHSRPGDASGENPPAATPSHVQPEGYQHAETALGGADSVQKTSYVVGEGTEPAGAPRAGVIARTTTGGGVNVGAWVVGILAFVIALVYAFGIFR